MTGSRACLCRWIQPLIFKCRYVKMEVEWRSNHFNQLSSFEVEVIIRPLEQLSKVSVRCSFQEFLFRKFCANYYQNIFFSKIPCFQHILLNTFRRMCLKYESYSFRRILFYLDRIYSFVLSTQFYTCVLENSDA